MKINGNRQLKLVHFILTKFQSTCIHTGLKKTDVYTVQNRVKKNTHKKSQKCTERIQFISHR